MATVLAADGGVGVSRDEAVSRYGSHWLGSDVFGEGLVEQRLGENEDGSRSRDRAAAKLRKSRADNAAAYVGANGSWSPWSFDGLFILLAKARLLPGSRRILADEAVRAARSDRFRSMLETIGSWEPRTVCLPESMRLPHHIPVGATVYRVAYDDPIRDGVRIAELRVASVVLERHGERSGGRNGYDAAPIYHCDRDAAGEGRETFVYDRGDDSDPEIANDGHSRLFLTRKAAVACAGRIAEALRAAASTVPTA